MLKTECLQEFNEIIAADNFHGRVDGLILPVPNLFYSQLLSQMMQHMDNIGCQDITKYLAKIYLDSYILRQPSVSTESLRLLGLSAIKLAVKFNESFDYPVATAVALTGNMYKAKEILDCEHLLLQTLKFKLKVTTPFCYIKSIKEMVPLDNKAIFDQLNLIIEYCSMLPELVGCSSGEIFFAVFVFLCKSKGFFEEVRQVVLALASRWPAIQELADLIRNIIDNDNESNQQGLEDTSMEVEE